MHFNFALPSANCLVTFYETAVFLGLNDVGEILKYIFLILFTILKSKFSKGRNVKKEKSEKFNSHTSTFIYTALYSGLKLYHLDWLLRKVKHFDLTAQELSKCSFQVISLNSNMVVTGWITAFSTFPGVRFYMLSAFQKDLYQTSQI